MVGETSVFTVVLYLGQDDDRPQGLEHGSLSGIACSHTEMKMVQTEYVEYVPVHVQYLRELLSHAQLQTC